MNIRDAYWPATRGTDHLLSNIPADNAAAALQAALETGYTDMTIGRATDTSGYPVVGCVGLFASEWRERGPFWARYRELTQEATE